jgi:hypothetical protein
MFVARIVGCAICNLAIFDEVAARLAETSGKYL